MVLSKDFLTFVIDDKNYAVPLLCLQGIIGNPNIDPAENAPDFVEGFFNINNFEIPIIDLRLILNKPSLICPNKTCVVIVRISFKGIERLVGFVVDSLFGVDRIQISEIEKLPACEANEYIDGVSYVKEKMVLFLSLEKIINENKIISFLNDFWNDEASINENKNKNGV